MYFVILVNEFRCPRRVQTQNSNQTLKSVQTAMGKASVKRSLSVQFHHGMPSLYMFNILLLHQSSHAKYMSFTQISIKIVHRVIFHAKTIHVPRHKKMIFLILFTQRYSGRLACLHRENALSRHMLF